MVNIFADTGMQAIIGVSVGVVCVLIYMNVDFNNIDKRVDAANAAANAREGIQPIDNRSRTSSSSGNSESFLSDSSSSSDTSVRRRPSIGSDDSMMSYRDAIRSDRSDSISGGKPKSLKKHQKIQKRRSNKNRRRKLTKRSKLMTQQNKSKKN
jgi:hypothetical protein